MEDAEVLKELYETIKQNSKADYAGIIEQRASYPYLYHLSQIRENLVSFLPFDKDMRVLECNPECGALTGKLLAMAGGVTALAESELQEKILRERFKEPQEREKLDIRRQLPEHGRFDVILIAGHFYRWEKQLPALRELLAPGGKFYVADANRIGLKYLAGCQEEYCGGYFTGIDGYPDAAAVGTLWQKLQPGRVHKAAAGGGIWGTDVLLSLSRSQVPVRDLLGRVAPAERRTRRGAQQL